MDNGTLNLHSYVVITKSSGKQNVLLLLAVPPLLAATKDDNKSKLAIYKLYDFSKGRTDIIDQRMGFYSCKSKSKRWTMNVFLCVLDTCRVNAGMIYAMNNDLQPRNIKSVDFGFELAMSLIRPHRVQQSLIDINSFVVRKIEIVLGKKIPQTCKNIKWLFSSSK